MIVHASMKCEICGGKMEVVRRCRQVRLKCKDCSKEFQIHQVASKLDRETEEELGKYTTIIYD